MGKRISEFLIMLTGIIFSNIIMVNIVDASTYTWTGATDNNWNNTGNWSSSDGGTQYPGFDVTDTATFNSSYTSSCNISSAITVGTITMDTGYIGTITASANFTTNDFTFKSGTFRKNNNPTITINGTFNKTGGTILFNGGTQIVDFKGSTTFSNASNTIYGTIYFRSTASVTINSAVILPGNIIVENGCVVGGSSYINIGSGGNASITNNGTVAWLYFRPSGGAPTITFSGTGTYTKVEVNIGSGSPNDKMILGSSLICNQLIIDDANDTDVFDIDTNGYTVTTGSLTINSLGYMKCRGSNINVTGNVIVNSTGKLDADSSIWNITGTGNFTNSGIFNGGNSTFNVQGTFTNSGTFDAGTSTYVFTGNNTLPVNTWYNLTVGAGTTTLGGNCTVSNNLTISSGATLNPSSYKVYNKNFYIPQNLVLTSSSGSNPVSFSWEHPKYTTKSTTSGVATVSKYKIYRKKDSGSYSQIGETTDGNTITYADNTIPDNGTYSYYVTSVPDTNIESNASSVITKTVNITKEPDQIDPNKGGESASIDDISTKIIVPAKALKNTYYWEIKKSNSIDINNSDKVVAVYEVKASEKSDMTNVKTILEGSVSISIHTTIGELQGIDSTITASNVRDKVKVAYWNKRQWLPLTSEVVLSSNNTDVQVTARTNHLSQYGITTVSKSGEVQVNVSPNPFTPAASQYNIVNFTFENTDNENIEIKIWDITGVLVRTITSYATSSISWDGKDERGDICESGVYIYQIKVGNSRAGKGTVVLAK